MNLQLAKISFDILALARTVNLRTVETHAVVLYNKRASGTGYLVLGSRAKRVAAVSFAACDVSRTAGSGLIFGRNRVRMLLVYDKLLQQHKLQKIHDSAGVIASGYRWPADLQHADPTISVLQRGWQNLRG